MTEITTAEREQLARLYAESLGFNFDDVSDERREYYRGIIDLRADLNASQVLAPLRLIRSHRAMIEAIESELAKVQLDPSAGPLVCRVAGLVEAYLQLTTETEDDERGLPRALAMAKAEDLR